jgi:enoyl-CoA hydratase/carnithine racemase
MELIASAVRLPADLDTASVAALARDFEGALASDVPVVTLVGASEDTYCLGLAIGSSLSGTPATHAFSDLLLRMHDSPKPLMAVVDGRAIGGGMGLACACDWVLATERASFALPELLWGLVPAIIWPVITDRMAPHIARQWTVSAYARTGAQGVDAGLVDELVPAERLDRAIGRAARTLGRLDPEALRRMRGWARASRQLELHDALRTGADLTAEMVQQSSVRRRWQAFEQGGAPWSA